LHQQHDSIAAHSNAAYFNISKAHSQAGAHIMLSDNIPMKVWENTASE
jgi:hypothetical protein